MKDDNIFVTYEVAKRLAEVGFQDSCMCGYDKNINTGEIQLRDTNYGLGSNWPWDNLYGAPLYQQVINWFEERKIYLSRYWYDDGVTPTRWVYTANKDRQSMYLGSNTEQAFLRIIDVYERESKNTKAENTNDSKG